MSHALLLRLFLSPSFFSVHVALQYLKLYADNIGITYYITRRLRELDTQELRDVWGFICHLLVTRPSKSRALECFVVEVAQRSTHIAMITLWFMQASLQDLVLRHNTQSFLICRRILHVCHEIIFGDLPPPISGPYSSSSSPFQLLIQRRKVRANVEPAFVGIGMMLAGAAGLPQLTRIMGEVAIEQGRVDEEGGDISSVELQEELAEGSSAASVENIASNGNDANGKNQDSQRSGESARSVLPVDPLEPQTPSRLSSKSRRSTICAAQTSPALVHLRKPHKPRLSDDPLDQLDRDSAGRVTTPYQSSPSIPSSSSPFRTNLTNVADSLLQKYDLQSQTHLLRSQYFRSEIQFLLALETISNRLLVVPKPARVSALRAELTALNHKLPAEVCMPMWCSSSDTMIANKNAWQPHHRVVRIPPGESVVLNSAERTPYLLLIETLHDDLDFDPTKRSNKDILKKMIIKENEKKGASNDLISFATSPGISRQKSFADPIPSPGPALGDEAIESSSSVPQTPMSASTTSLNGEEEEIDLVEQLYGPGQSLRGPIDLSESVVLPATPKNKELDMVAWSRVSSVPPSPSADPGSAALRSTPVLHPSNGHLSTSLVTSKSTSSETNEKVRVLSLEDYSERMRTAAIMLSQLNANLIREPVTSLAGPGSGLGQQESQMTSGRSSWIPGSSWLGGHPDSVSGGPLHPSLGGRAPDPSAVYRMRVQPAEAAAIRDRIMQEMMSLEEERMERMRENRDAEGMMTIGDVSGGLKSAEDENIIKRELNKVDPSAVVFSESWAAKKSRIRHASPYGHLANWDCVSVIVKTGGDLRQEQLAVQVIQEFERIWQEENCRCWVRYFRILITGGSSGLVETITDAVSIHSIKKAEYARRLAGGRLGHVTLLDHFKATYGDISSAKFARAQRNFATSLAGYSIVTFLLQIKDRHNGNILLDREGHLIHIDFGFMLSNSPGNIGFEAAPFKLPLEYIEVLGGVDSEPFKDFKRLFQEGFEAARKHCDRIITLVELMQKDSNLPCFAAFGEQTASMLRDRFQPALTHSLVGEYVDRLIDSSLGANWTRLYDSYQYYSQSIL